MRCAPRAHFCHSLGAAITVAILRLALPFALARRLARPATHRRSAIALMIAIPRIRQKQLRALAAFASAGGVHPAHRFAQRPRRQTRRRSPNSVHEGKKINPAEGDDSSLNGEADRPEENLGFQTGGFRWVSSRRWHSARPASRHKAAPTQGIRRVVAVSACRAKIRHGARSCSAIPFIVRNASGLFRLIGSRWGETRVGAFSRNWSESNRRAGPSKGPRRRIVPCQVPEEGESRDRHRCRLNLGVRYDIVIRKRCGKAGLRPRAAGASPPACRPSCAANLARSP